MSAFFIMLTARGHLGCAGSRGSLQLASLSSLVSFVLVIHIGNSLRNTAAIRPADCQQHPYNFNEVNHISSLT